MGLTAKFTELITIQRLIPSGTSYGAVIEVWQDFKQLYVSILSQQGNTGFNAPGNVYGDNVKFYSRFIPLDGTKGFRIRYNNKYYEIINYTTVQRNRDLIIDCKAVY
jgi:head-tail adaptor